ncbi:MAG: ribosomal protein L7/L12 [Bacilli bacterium]|nr:ribosomal protein L7/L12 [Bacilli bacterium]
MPKDIENSETTVSEKKANQNVNNVDTILDMISNLTLLDAHELSEKMSEKFGISANLVQASNNGGKAAAADDSNQAKVSVIVNAFKAGTKIQLVKRLSQLNDDMPFLEAGKRMNVLPFVFKENITPSEAEKIKEELIQKYGADVEIK